MTSLEKWAGYIGSGLVLLFATGLVGWLWGRSELRKDIALAPRDTVNHIETVIVHVPEIQYVNLPARVDTLRDTTYLQLPVVVASVDTVLAVHQDTLGIKYFYPPINTFSLDFRPGPIPVLVKVETVTKTVIETEVSFPWVIGGVAAGVVAGILIESKIK